MSIPPENEFASWITRHRASLDDYARQHGGTSEDVARALQRAGVSEQFPANENYWRGRVEWTIDSVIFTRVRSEQRAAKAQQTLGVIYSDGPVRLHYWPAPLDEVFVRPEGHCKKCGFILWSRLERETPEDNWIEVYGCANGHRQYPKVNS